MSTNIKLQQYSISRDYRRKLKGHKSLLIWFTGLSGSGKSTISNALELQLYKENIHTYSLDGDNLRHGLNKDLTFSDEHRTENIRRVAEISKLFVDSGIVVLAAFISPFIKDREFVKKTVTRDNYFEIYVKTPIETCEKRDVKGLYKKARNGKILNFTGIDSPYEAPINPNLIIDTDKLNIDESVQLILNKIKLKLKNE